MLLYKKIVKSLNLSIGTFKLLKKINGRKKNKIKIKFISCKKRSFLFHDAGNVKIASLTEIATEQNVMSKLDLIPTCARALKRD